MPWYRGPTLMAHLDTVAIDDEAASADAPVEVADQFEASIVWLDEAPLLRGRSYPMKTATATANATVAPLKYRLDVHSLEHVAADKLERNEIGVGNIELDRPITFLPYAIRPRSWRLHSDRPARRATPSVRGSCDSRCAGRTTFIDSPSTSTRIARATQKSQRPCVLWFTGISGAGKSTIANLCRKQAARAGPAHVRARRRQRPPRPQQGSRLHRGRSRGEHPSGGGGRQR